MCRSQKRSGLKNFKYACSSLNAPRRCGSSLRANVTRPIRGKRRTCSLGVALNSPGRSSHALPINVWADRFSIESELSTGTPSEQDRFTVRVTSIPSVVPRYKLTKSTLITIISSAS